MGREKLRPEVSILGINTFILEDAFDAGGDVFDRVVQDQNKASGHGFTCRALDVFDKCSSLDEWCVVHCDTHNLRVA